MKQLENIDLRRADSMVKEIESIVTKYNMTYVEGLLHYMDLHSIDEEQVAQYVVGPLRAKIAKEASDLHLIVGEDEVTELEV